MQVNFMPLESDLPADDDLGEVKVSFNATRKDWENYPKEAKRHPERNHPRFVEALIRELSPMAGRVHDPQCGIGTVVQEASWLGRVSTGWDIRAKWRKVVMKISPEALMFTPDESSIDLVVTSPSYGNMNHSLGKQQKQIKVRKRLGSSQGQEMTGVPDLNAFDVSSSSNMEEWEMKFGAVLRQIFRMLKPGGKLALIAKEKVSNQRPFGILRSIRNSCARNGLVYEGYYWRQLQPSGLRRAQGKLFKQQTGKDPVFPDKEYALVFRKPIQDLKQS